MTRAEAGGRFCGSSRKPLRKLLTTLHKTRSAARGSIAEAPAKEIIAERSVEARGLEAPTKTEVVFAEARGQKNCT